MEDSAVRACKAPVGPATLQKLMGALSISKKAGALAAGFDVVCQNLHLGKAHLLLFAKDLSPKTQKRVLAMAGKEVLAYNLPLGQDDIAAITRKSVGVLAVTNQDLTALIVKALEEEPV